MSAFTLAGRDGEVYEFVTTEESSDGEGGPLTAGHMRQDAALGLETLVRYRVESDRLIAVTAGHPRGHATPTAAS